MANTLTSLIPTMYAALDKVSRELVGFVAGVTRDSGVERAALNQTVLVPVTPAASSADNTPGVTPPDTGDQTIDNVSLSISKSKHVAVRWNGEETLGLQNAGTYDTINVDRFAQAMRTLVNLVEVDLASMYAKASRAYGTAGTTPFGTAGDLSDAAFVHQILDDNGTPLDDRHLVLSNAAIANIRAKQSVLFKVNEAGTDALLRRGIIGDLEGFSLHQSGQVASHTKGSGASYQTNNGAGYAVGDTAITLDTGSGTILAGDVVTFAGDSNKYVTTTALASNVVTIAKPGLRATLADNVALTVGNSYRANMAFHRSAIVLATRLPALPAQGDMAVDRTIVQDPVSGLAFEVAAYPGFRQMTYHVSLAWGYQLIKPEHTAILMG